MALTDRLDRRFGWDRLPPPLGVLTLIGVRNRLRQRNLTDTGLPAASADLIEKAGDPAYRSRRSLDGTLNDPRSPLMGGVGTRFGRNVPLAETFPDPPAGLLEPNPRTISRELMTRERFTPATTLNVLAAAWIQFEVHDWFSHGRNEERNPWQLALAEDDDWPDRPMTIPRTRRDPTSDRDPGTPETFVTADSHWWDGSQIYGSEERFASAVRAREDGKLRIGSDGLPPRDLERLVDLGGVGGNFWVGLALLHTLFTLEHNSICDRLRREHPGWSDDRLYDKARLINAALMARIHTTEWTPAIIAHPTTRYAMRATWSGIVGERLGRRLGHLGPGDVVSGIPGSRTDHHGVPYSLTEEFVAVYRMHPLLPDEFSLRSVTGGELLEERTFPELGALHVRERLERVGVANSLYSFGIAHPGTISLHNYPRFLQHLERPDGTRLDLAATDILRIRERGVPRYNEFRRLFRLRPAQSFAELTDDPQEAERIRRAYGGEIERVDLMVGLYAEPKPRGFGFSDTAFRVFILMASRRLKSDRFFTRDYTPRMYTRAGLDWINDSTMGSVLLRHYPSLAPALRGVKNAFAPWARVG
ncbi:MAG: peroxidase [Solirubrobacterales bacterium]|nr:peroxidase [Solirubrobacterales bacterium]